MAFSKSALAAEIAMAHVNSLRDRGHVKLDALDASREADNAQQKAAIAQARAQLDDSHGQAMTNLKGIQLGGKAAASVAPASPGAPEQEPPSVPAPMQMNTANPMAGMQTAPFQPLLDQSANQQPPSMPTSGGVPAGSSGMVNPVGGATAQQALAGMGGGPQPTPPQTPPPGPPGMGTPQTMPVGQPGGGMGLSIPPWLISARASQESGRVPIGASLIPEPTQRVETSVQPNVLSAGEAGQLGIAQARLGYEQFDKVADNLAASASVYDARNPQAQAQALNQISQLPPFLRQMATTKMAAMMAEQGKDLVKVVPPGQTESVWITKADLLKKPPGYFGAKPESLTNVGVDVKLPKPDLPGTKAIDQFQAAAGSSATNIANIEQMQGELSPSNFSSVYRAGGDAAAWLFKQPVLGDAAKALASAKYGPNVAQQLGDWRAALDRANSWAIQFANSELGQGRMSPRERDAFIKDTFNQDMMPEEANKRFDTIKKQQALMEARLAILTHGGYGDRAMQSALSSGQFTAPQLLDMFPLDRIQNILDERAKGYQQQNREPRKTAVAHVARDLGLAPGGQ